MKISFAYNEPGFGIFELEGPEDWTDEEIKEEIESTYPEYVDIDILEKVD